MRTFTTFNYQEFIDQIYTRLGVKDIYINSSHQFKISSDRYRRGCPFHQSKSGTSFVVDKKSLLFWCAGCHYGGSAIDYLYSLKVGHCAKPRGRDFVEAVESLAKLAEMHLPKYEQNPPEVEQARKWELRRSILQALSEYGQEVLWSSRGINARRYLIEERGLSEDEIRDLRLGFYLSQREVQQVLTSKGYNLQDCKDVGVLWSKLEGYILFPWLDSYGRALTIYGRYHTKTPPQGKPKTIALKGEGTKGSPLYLDKALEAGHKNLILVEGVIDAALLQANGDTRVCAYVAGSCSNQQIETMKRRGIETVILCGDPDTGGANGTNSNLIRLMDAGISVSVAPVLPDGLDPDEFLNREGMERWKAHIEAADHGFRWKAQQIIRSHSKGNLTDSDRQKILKDAIAFAANQSHDKHELEAFFWSVIGQVVGMDVPAWIRDIEPI